MSTDTTDSLSLSRRVLGVLIKLNLVFGLFILALLIASLVAEETVFRALGALPAHSLPGDRADLIYGMRGIMVIGLLAIPVTQFVLTGLLAIVETVREGNPFISRNAARLRSMAWAMLALEVMSMIVGLIAKTVSTNGVPLDIKFSISITRWLTVLLLFVLARVFEEGARMRDDLDGTV